MYCFSTLCAEILYRLYIESLLCVPTKLINRLSLVPTNAQVGYINSCIPQLPAAECGRSQILLVLPSVAKRCLARLWGPRVAFKWCCSQRINVVENRKVKVQRMIHMIVCHFLMSLLRVRVKCGARGAGKVGKSAGNHGGAGQSAGNVWSAGCG